MSYIIFTCIFCFSPFWKVNKNIIVALFHNCLIVAINEYCIRCDDLSPNQCYAHTIITCVRYKFVGDP
jgi:hypothetical protein